MSIKGYKVFNPDWTCRDFQYEVGKTYKHEGNIEMCGKGFHFCQKVTDCFAYYSFDPRNKVAEVEALGNTETRGDKSVTDRIHIVREVSWEEMLRLANEGIGNTGLRNTGNRNTGNRNTGNRNTGNRNTGNRNTGNRNTGNRNTGNRNTGNRNTGDWNTGDWNTGHWNTGDWNTGHWNTGHWNTGDWNTGHWNTGHWNTGHWNSCDFSSGFFCSKTPAITVFNSPTNLSREEFLNNEGVKILNWNYENNWWIYTDNMTDEEKKQHPEYETTGGYLKSVPFKEACAIMWDTLDEKERQAVKGIPNFDAEVFEEITGIDVNK